MSLKNMSRGADTMAQQANVLAAKTDHRNVIPGTQKAEGQLLKVVL